MGLPKDRQHVRLLALSRLIIQPYLEKGYFVRTSQLEGQQEAVESMLPCYNTHADATGGWIIKTV